MFPPATTEAPPPPATYAPAPAPALIVAYAEPEDNGPVNYNYQYGVTDDSSGLNLGHNEIRAGKKQTKSQSYRNSFTTPSTMSTIDKYIDKQKRKDFFSKNGCRTPEQCNNPFRGKLQWSLTSIASKR